MWPPEARATANAVLAWYDHDESGKIELHEFAVMARDASVFAAYDKDHSGTLDAASEAPWAEFVSVFKLDRIFTGWAPQQQQVRCRLGFNEFADRILGRCAERAGLRHRPGAKHTPRRPPGQAGLADAARADGRLRPRS